ncbi:MAG: hypothetical protein ACYDCL_06535 [Myxococcales bacterium]
MVIDAQGRHARALFRVEGDGTAGDVHVGYVGGEELGLTLGAGGWEPDAGVFLPRLEGLLDALERRRAAASAGDAVALAGLAVDPGAAVPAGLAAGPARLRAYFIRVEGERATVSEVDGPSDRPLTRRMELRRGKDGWRFAAGLL